MAADVLRRAAPCPGFEGAESKPGAQCQEWIRTELASPSSVRAPASLWVPQINIQKSPQKNSS